ncbi:hypothetical protein [Cryobacterium sp. Hz7]|nr:hypothetical protein [Cryobacterium sp. Hz7]
MGQIANLRGERPEQAIIQSDRDTQSVRAECRDHKQRRIIRSMG